MKALIYSRVSTEEQAKEDRCSLDVQKRLCREFAKHNGYEVVDVFEDAGKSATNMKRPALQDLMAFISDQQNIDVVLVQDTDRIARNTKDHLTIKAFLKKNNCRLISISQPQIDDSAEGMMIDTILASFNEFQSSITGRKTKKGLEQKAINGWRPNEAPIGYINTANEKGENIIMADKNQSKFIKMAFDMYITGEYGAETINDILYAKGFRSKRNNKVAMSTFYRFLESPFYYGEFKWGNKKYKGNHEPLITQEIWELAQKIRESRTLRKNYERKHNFLLSSFIQCKCGHRFTAEKHVKPSGLVFIYYHCTEGKKCQDSRNVSAKDLEKQVEEKFKEIQFSDEFYDKLIVRLKKYHDNFEIEVVQRVKELNRSKTEVIKKQTKLESLLLSETVDADMYKRNSEKLKQDLENIEYEIVKANRGNNIDVGAFKEVIDFARDVYEAYKKCDFEGKRKYLAFFWERFIVEDKQIIEAVPTELFRALQEINLAIQKTQLSQVFGSALVNPPKTQVYDLAVINPALLGSYRGSNPR